MTTDKAKRKHNPDEKNWLEWLVFCVSLLLLLSILGYLVYQVSSYKAQDPDVYAEAQPDPSVMAPNRYQVAVYNKGGSTAEEVITEFILYTDGKEKEKAELMTAFSPKDSKQEGWVIFSGQPSDKDSVVARIVSFKKP
ncbi:hypothetical protein H8S95_01230 [Pontibacter sp. KCTC 32443]|uniref:hypothetical protein n=1 Tax=Pontibacter TaxID=323449 RepID=UPI00164DAF07|nr:MULTISPECIES: hypothetical protein [Pontibacter]MBC5772670.1 hypothetical protein [Pontibacter sp. KCTC 32443]